MKITNITTLAIITSIKSNHIDKKRTKINISAVSNHLFTHTHTQKDYS